MKEKVDVKNVNSIIGLSKRILKILYFLLIIVAIYSVTLIVKEWHILSFFKVILSILAPLFIGILIAWLFDPFVTWLGKKGMRRSIGATVTYVLFLGVLILIVTSIIPILYQQSTDFVKMIPNMASESKESINNALSGIRNIGGINIDQVKDSIFNHIEKLISSFSNNLPGMAIVTIKSVFSGAGILIVGLVIGFYLLLSFDNIDNILTFLPGRSEKFARELIHEINISLRGYVIGAICDATLIFVVTSIVFSFIGLRGSLLFGLFCGITNIIPYAGPYIGGVPAVIVGFSMSPTIGILTLSSIFIIQFIEGNFLQSLILSKTTKLHPVTIIIGLLVFGHFWGVIGMVISTPVIATVKTIVKFINERYSILDFN